MATNFTSKNIKYFTCEICDFKCSKKGDYTRHLNTRKHVAATNGNTFNIKKTSHVCDICNKVYLDRSGLWRHRKTCVGKNINENENVNQTVHEKVNETGNENINENVVIENDKSIDKELLVKMLLKNQDVMEKMIEMMPNIGNNSHNNTNSHNTNNFNIQMFLNERCKNAMNITDFIHSLPVTAETFDNTIENGLTKSITTMITNGLNNMDVLDRPIHCTDVNRKTLYVKDNDSWERDNELRSLLDGIKELSIKQRTSINKWQDANEGWEKDDNLQTKLSSLVFHSMEDIENNEKEVGKIIRAISKNTYLNNEIKEIYK